MWNLENVKKTNWKIKNIEDLEIYLQEFDFQKELKTFNFQKEIYLSFLYSKLKDKYKEAFIVQEQTFYMLSEHIVLLSFPVINYFLAKNEFQNAIDFLIKNCPDCLPRKFLISEIMEKIKENKI